MFGEIGRKYVQKYVHELKPKMQPVYPSSELVQQFLISYSKKVRYFNFKLRHYIWRFNTRNY